MDFDDWMLTKEPKYHTTDDTVALRRLRECWNDAQKYAAPKVGTGGTAQPVEFLLGGARLKLSFQQEECESCGASSAHFRTVPMDQYAEELQGCWVALVPAENDRHLRMVATHNVM